MRSVNANQTINNTMSADESGAEQYELYLNTPVQQKAPDEQMMMISSSQKETPPIVV